MDEVGDVLVGRPGFDLELGEGERRSPPWDNCPEPPWEKPWAGPALRPGAHRYWRLMTSAGLGGYVVRVGRRDS